MNKSEFLNQRQPLYTTRNNPNVIAFRAQSRQRIIDAQRSIREAKTIHTWAQLRINWISSAYDSLKNRMVDNLLQTENPFK